MYVRVGDGVALSQFGMLHGLTPLPYPRCQQIVRSVWYGVQEKNKQSNKQNNNTQNKLKTFIMSMTLLVGPTETPNNIILL